jgi:imidazolonepropionase-like amidohydrolase
MKFSFLLFPLAFGLAGNAQVDTVYLLKPQRVFDGETMHTGWVVLVKGNKIEEAGPLNFSIPAGATIIEMKNATLLPGLIEGHSHLFLHPYNEVSWNDQVLKESRAERTGRAVMHAQATLLAGFTTTRDLGTEGAMYDDAGLKSAIEKNVIPGPRMIIATRAIVATGTYGPKYGNADINLPQGAAEVSDMEDMAREVYTQISKGADVVKLYVDYRWGDGGQAMPTFSIEQIALAANIAKSSGRIIAAHATTKEGMRRAILGGVTTIEHGNDGDDEVFTMMHERGIALCPTLAGYEAIEQYHGWRKGIDPDPPTIIAKKKSFQSALRNGVTICMGGDVGVFPHGENAREMELMVEYGMKPIDVLRSATSVNADVFGYGGKIGRIRGGLLADIVAVQGDPSANIDALQKIIFVMKDGKIYKHL